jgi:hypothetical protein
MTKILGITEKPLHYIGIILRFRGRKGFAGALAGRIVGRGDSRL